MFKNNLTSEKTWLIVSKNWRQWHKLDLDDDMDCDHLDDAGDDDQDDPGDKRLSSRCTEAPRLHSVWWMVKAAASLYSGLLTEAAYQAKAMLCLPMLPHYVMLPMLPHYVMLFFAVFDFAILCCALQNMLLLYWWMVNNTASHCLPGRLDVITKHKCFLRCVVLSRVPCSLLLSFCCNAPLLCCGKAATLRDALSLFCHKSSMLKSIFSTFVCKFLHRNGFQESGLRRSHQLWNNHSEVQFCPCFRQQVFLKRAHGGTSPTPPLRNCGLGVGQFLANYQIMLK